MPIYQFVCNDCGIFEEINVPMDERNDLIECTCGGVFVRKWGVGGVVIR
jgi:putative FmdB family regulatory protein